MFSSWPSAPASNQSLFSLVPPQSPTDFRAPSVTAEEEAVVTRVKKAWQIRSGLD